MSDNITPEEKLLKLIRKDKKPKPDTVLYPEPKIQTSPHPAFFQKYFHSLNLKKTVIIIFVLSCAYLSINFIYPFFGLKKTAMPKITAKLVNGPAFTQINGIKPFEYYAGALQNRQLFTLEGSSDGQKGQTASAVAGPELMKNFNLVGVIAGENAQAIIEDKLTLKTYYVNKGQSIGEFKVEDVLEGKIILSYHGQTYELNL